MKKYYAKPTILKNMPMILGLILLCATGCVRQEQPTQEPEADLTNLKEIFNTPIPAPRQIDPNQVEIKVNDVPITRGAILQQANIVAATQGRGLSREQLMQNRERIVAQARDTLILQALLSSEVEAENIEVSEEEWATKLAEIKQSLPEGTELEDALEKSNVNMENFKASQISRMKLDKLVKSKMPELPDPSEEEAKAYYDANPNQFKIPESVNFQVLSINQPASDDEATKKAKLEQAEVIRKELVEGADMSEKVKAHSDHPSKEKDGKVRIYKGTTGIQELESILFTLKIGNYTDVIVLPNQYVIYKALEALPAGMTPYADVKERIQNALKQQRTKEAFNEYIQALREKANIEMVGQPTTGAPAQADGAGADAPSK